MAKFKSEDLLQALCSDVEQIRTAARYFREADKNKLIYTPSENEWSVVQILEHLNAYGRFYLPAFRKAMDEQPGQKSAWFQSGFWGDYFTKTMKPSNVYEVKNKMKAMKAYTFGNGLNVETVVREFEQQQEELLDLLRRAGSTDLGAARVPISITKMIRLKLGDALRFLVAHEQRHMIQARNTLKKVGVATDHFPVILSAGNQQAALA